MIGVGRAGAGGPVRGVEKDRTEPKAEAKGGERGSRGALLERELQGLRANGKASRDGTRSVGKGKGAIDDPEVLTTAKRWAYIDPNDEIHSGFTTEDMRQWFNLGYFEEGLKIALLPENGSDDAGHNLAEPPRRQFYPLKQWFPEAKQAFTCIPRL